MAIRFTSCQAPIGAAFSARTGFTAAPLVASTPVAAMVVTAATLALAFAATLPVAGSALFERRSGRGRRTRWLRRRLGR